VMWLTPRVRATWVSASPASRRMPFSLIWLMLPCRP
jgi:hypothetical protein